MINTIGGITINVQKRQCNMMILQVIYILILRQVKTHLMVMSDTIKYLRYRNSKGDIGRIERQ